MKYDIIVIGAGPAGYVAAIRAGQLGLKTAIVEKKHLGGMCLNWGCIPTKAIIESARFYKQIHDAENFGIDGIEANSVIFNWEKVKNRALSITKKLTLNIDCLLKKNGVHVILGEAKIATPFSVTVENRMIETNHILIATGSKPQNIDVKINYGSLLQVEDLFTLNEIPSKIIVYGKGGVALEMAQFFNMIGKEVTVISPDKNVLPAIDAYLIENILHKVIKDGINIVYGNLQEEINKFESENLPNDFLVLNCSERKAIIPEANIALDFEKGFIKTNENFETNYSSIFAVGDVNGISYLAHVASAQGLWVVNHIKGVKEDFNSKNFPYNFYTTPEIAQIGSTEQQLIEMNIEYKINEFPFSANAKAMIDGDTEGRIRILSEKKYGKVLGIQIISANATDMIAEASAFMQVEATVYDVAKTIHAHPTVSEIFMDAGFLAIE